MTTVDKPTSQHSIREGEPSRARYPDVTGFAEREGRRLYWELYGEGERTVLFLPTWSNVHSRVWKMQIPYFARHYRVLTYDGVGNGRSDRSLDPAAYSHDEFALDALAVMDATSTDRAVLVAVSRGTQWGLVLAADHPDRVNGALFAGAFFPATVRSSRWRIAKRLGLTERSPEESWLARIFARLDERARRMNAPTIRADYPGFVHWFCNHVATEPHSTKEIEDTIRWGLETDAETIIATMQAPILLNPRELRAVARRVRCPVVVVAGARDVLSPVRDQRALARATRGELVVLNGAHHVFVGRRPVAFNLVLREFVEALDA